MKRKLLILNLALAGLAVYAGMRFRQEWVASKARERAMIGHRVPPAPTPKFTPAPIDPPLMASGYADVANKMLFDKSRNPVVVEVVAPPPPPPPMPALPLYHGMMNLGEDSPTLFFSVSPQAPHQAVHVGDMIGQFKLLDVNSEAITFEWNGKEVRKSIEELSRTGKEASRDEVVADNRPAAPAAAPTPPPAARNGPGEDTGRGFRACSANDGVADGAVVDGYRKVMYTTPFGQACRYEPVK